jgi:hypothetical protein
MKVFLSFYVVILAASASAAPSISLSDASALATAAMTAAESLLKYYVPNFSGSILANESKNSSGVQWYYGMIE